MRWIALLSLILAGNAQAAPPYAAEAAKKVAEPFVHLFERKPPPPPPSVRILIERPANFHLTLPRQNVILEVHSGAVTTPVDVIREVGDKAAKECASPSDRKRCQEMLDK